MRKDKNCTTRTMPLRFCGNRDGKSGPAYPQGLDGRLPCHYKHLRKADR